MKNVLILFLFFACNFEGTPPPKVEPTKSPSIFEFKGHWNNSHYDKLLFEGLVVYGKELLKVVPTDSKDFITSWPSDENGVLRFWMTTIIEMAKWESSWKPETAYTEKFKDQTKQYVVSRGLLQISFESGKGYGCPLTKAEDLHDPKLNLECGVRILNRWVVRHNRIAGKIGDEWQGASKYWSVMRRPDTGVKDSFEAIKAVNKNAKM